MILAVIVVILMSIGLFVWAFAFFDNVLSLLIYFDTPKPWALGLILLLIIFTQSITIKVNNKEKLYQLMPRFYRKLLYVFSILAVTYWVWIDKPYQLEYLILFTLGSIMLVGASSYTLVKEYIKDNNSSKSE